MANITRDFLRLIRVDLDKALADVAKKNGLDSLSAGSMSFSDNEFTVKVTGVASGNAKAEKDAQDSKRYAQLLGLPEDIIGKEITVQGMKLRVTEIDLRKPKNPVIAVGVDNGRQYKMPETTVKSALARMK